jgi:hypothetical protein
VDVKLWQYWELSLAEEFWPLSRQQVDGVLWRWRYSKAEFERKLAEWSGGDQFYEHKARAVYGGTFLSAPAVRRSVLRIVKGFAMLEAALADQGRDALAAGSSASPWLVGGLF